MDIIKVLSEETNNIFFINFNFNKIGFFIDMINRLPETKSDSCPNITYNDFIMSYFLPCVKKYILGKPKITTGGKKGKYISKYSKRQTNKKRKCKSKSKRQRKITKKIRGGNRLQWHIIISFFFLIMNLLNSSAGQLQLNSEREYKHWKQSLIETRHTDVFQNDLGICNIDAYAAAGFFPIAQYKQLLELQLGLFAFNMYKYHPGFHKDENFDIQKLEIEEASNITIDAYRINIPKTILLDASKIYQLLLDGFLNRFEHIENNTYIIGTMSYQYIPEPNETPGSHEVNIIYSKNADGIPSLEIIDLSTNEIGTNEITDEINPFQATEYIQKYVKPDGQINIYFSKQQSIKNIPTSFKDSINMVEIEQSLRIYTPFPELPPDADDIVYTAYMALQERIYKSEQDTMDILSIKTELNNFLIKTYGSLAAVYPYLQGPKLPTIKTYPKPSLKKITYF